MLLLTENFQLNPRFRETTSQRLIDSFPNNETLEILICECIKKSVILKDGFLNERFKIDKK